MAIANVSQVSAGDLPQALRAAQKAIHFPEIQARLRRLSESRLGIFKPHMHDEQTGEFQPFSDEVMQVESGLKVSFQSMEEIANQLSLFPCGTILACRRIDTLGSVRNGLGRKAGRYRALRQT